MGLFNLIFRLGIDNSDFNKKLSQAGKAFDNLGQSLTGKLSGWLGAAAIMAQVKKTIDFASHITDLSETLGIDPERLQEFDYAAKQTGTTIDDLAKAMKNLAVARQKALQDPNSNEGKAFAAFGFNADRLRTLSDASDLMLQFSDAIKGTTIDANSLPVILDLIGQKGMAAIPALTAGLREMGQEARNFGQVMKTEVLKQLDDMGDQFDTIAKQITVTLGPVLAWLARAIRDSISGLTALGKGILQGDVSNENMLKIINEMKAQQEALEQKGAKRAGGGFWKEQLESLLEYRRALGDTKSLMERILANETKLRHGTMSKEQIIAELEAQKKEIEGPGLEMPSLEQRLRLSEINLELQNLRKADGHRGDPSRTDSLQSVGNFLGGAPDMQLKQKMDQQLAALKAIENAVKILGREAVIFR